MTDTTNEATDTSADDHGKEQAIAQLESVRGMIAALECDYDRLQDLRDAVWPYTAGWNMAGYMPDCAPETFQTADDARAYIAAELRECAESVGDAASGETLQAMLDCADRLDEASADKAAAEFGATFNGLHFFIAFDPSPTAGLTDDEADELRELIEAAGDCEDADEARQRIEEDALSVEVRSSQWRTVGDTDDEPDEFRIVLCTGGPHVEIRGELRDGSPHRAWIAYRDWGATMAELPESWGDDAVLAYASVFYFGE